jgi:nicotinamide mononucleotide transporter
MNLYEFFEGVLLGINETTAVEWLAFFFSLIYVILAAAKSIWCWPFAFIGSSLYVYLCIVSQLYLESGLQLFFVVMALIGWVSWKHTEKKRLDIINWSVGQHLLNIVLSTMVALSLGWIFDQYTNQENPYVDAVTTVFSLAATFMVARKVLENWIYWIIIDSISIWLYAQRGLNLSSVLFLIYTVIAIVGFFSWYKQFKKQRA